MTELFTRDFVCAVCDHFVRVHIRLRAASRLPYDERKVFVELSFDHFVAGFFYARKFFRRHLFRLQRTVRTRGGFFQMPERFCDFPRHRFNADTDTEIFMAALGLRSPIFIGGNFYFSHRIVFNSEIAHRFSPYYY